MEMMEKERRWIQKEKIGKEKTFWLLKLRKIRGAKVRYRRYERAREWGGQRVGILTLRNCKKGRKGNVRSCLVSLFLVSPPAFKADFLNFFC